MYETSSIYITLVTVDKAVHVFNARHIIIYIISYLKLKVPPAGRFKHYFKPDWLTFMLCVYGNTKWYLVISDSTIHIDSSVCGTTALAKRQHDTPVDSPLG